MLPCLQITYWTVPCAVRSTRSAAKVSHLRGKLSPLLKVLLSVPREILLFAVLSTRRLFGLGDVASVPFHQRCASRLYSKVGDGASEKNKTQHKSPSKRNMVESQLHRLHATNESHKHKDQQYRAGIHWYLSVLGHQLFCRRFSFHLCLRLRRLRGVQVGACAPR